MSLIWQLHPHYGKDDPVWVLRDIDLATRLLNDKPEFQEIFRSTRDRVIWLLFNSPELWSTLRNSFFATKNETISSSDFLQLDRSNFKWADYIHLEYQRLMIFREKLLKNPQETLNTIIEASHQILSEFPLSKPWIEKISHLIESTDEKTFDRNAKVAKDIYWHIGLISFFEWCITAGKSLSQTSELAKSLRDTHESDKENSMEYWDFNNIMNLTETRIQIDSKNTIWWKSFSLSGGSWNTFAQLAFIYEHLKSGWTITSISGTSAGSAIWVLVGMIWNDADRIKELMDDLIQGNNNWDMPIYLIGSEWKMKNYYDWLAKKYGLGYDSKFNQLKIPVLVNAWRQYNWWEQEIVLGGNENIMDAIWASQNVPEITQPWKKNLGRLGDTKIHGVSMIDYAANERGNPTHWLDLIGIPQENIVAIDAGYSSERGGSPFVRRLFQRATLRDTLAKTRIANANGTVIDLPLDSQEWYSFPSGTIERFFEIWKDTYLNTEVEK